MALFLAVFLLLFLHKTETQKSRYINLLLSGFDIRGPHAFPARLGALTWLKNDSTVDSGPHPGDHQQRRLALKEPGPKFFGLFGVVHPREQCSRGWN